VVCCFPHSNYVRYDLRSLFSECYMTYYLSRGSCCVCSFQKAAHFSKVKRLKIRDEGNFELQGNRWNYGTINKSGRAPWIFNVEKLNLRGYKWNETVSNRIRYVSRRICNVSNEMCNTCVTSYVTADNSRPMAYLILKVICKWKSKDWSIQKWRLFYSQNNRTLFKQLPKTRNNFPNFTDFQPPATAKP
jgi:hypothetical protein